MIGSVWVFTLVAGWLFSVNPAWLLAAGGLIVLSATLIGTLPAYRASRMNPATAMRAREE